MKAKLVLGLLAGVALPITIAGVAAEAQTSTNQSPILAWPALTNLFRGTNSLFGKEPGPGIYKTEPYTLIVVVPQGDLDAKMLRPSEMPGAFPFYRQAPGEMPRYRPELRFVPRTRAIPPGPITTGKKK